MKTFDELQKMITDYEKTLAECNRVYRLEKMSPREIALSEQVDREFTQISDAVKDHISQLVENLNGAGIELHSVNLYRHEFNTPFHSFHAKIGENGYVGGNFVVKGFKYR